MTVGGESFSVTGLAWLDREWSTSSLEPGTAGWDWFALHLSDGSDLMFYRLRRTGGDASRFSGGTMVGVDGVRTRLVADDVTLTPLDYWTSDATGVRYPVAWRLDAEKAGIALEIEPYLENQELDLSVRYWEGAVRGEGTGPAGLSRRRGIWSWRGIEIFFRADDITLVTLDCSLVVLPVPRRVWREHQKYNEERISSATMDRRKTPRKDWVISKDDVGRSVLEWKVDPLRAKRMEHDPCARTYDFLQRLDAPDLALEDEAGAATRVAAQFQSLQSLRSRPGAETAQQALLILQRWSLRSGRGRAYARRPPTPPYVRFRIRRFLSSTVRGTAARAAFRSACRLAAAEHPARPSSLPGSTATGRACRAHGTFCSNCAEIMSD